MQGPGWDMERKHHVVVASWEQGGRPGEYTRLYEVRCDPCRWRSKHTDNHLLARTWAADHQGITRDAPHWQRGPGTGGAA